MGHAFSAFFWAMLLGGVFIPLFVIAIVMLRSPARAFVLSATFTMGAVAGFFAGALAGTWLMSPHSQETRSLVLLFAFAGAAAVAGGVIAVWLLGKVTRYPPWRRH